MASNGEDDEKCNICQIHPKVGDGDCESCTLIQEYWKRQAIERGMSLGDYLIQSAKWTFWE